MNTRAISSIFVVILTTLAIITGGCVKKEDSTPDPKDPPKVESKTEMPAIELTPAHSPNDDDKPQPKAEVDSAPFKPEEKTVTAKPATDGDIWIQDFEQAKKIAAQQGKDIIMNFTGSDWCMWCDKLDKEVFSQKGFIDVIPKKFVLLKLDFPKDESLITPEIKAQNEALQKEYPIPGFPAVFVTDSAGKQYAQTGYQDGGHEKYIEHLLEFQNSHKQMLELLKMADDPAVKGTDKAKLIDQAISLLQSEIVTTFHGDRIEQILSLDAENKAGLNAKYRALGKIDTAHQEIAAKNYDKAIEITDSILNEIKPTGETLQKTYLAKSEAYFWLEKKKESQATLLLALAAAPNSKKAPKIKNILERAFPKEKAEDAEQTQ